MGKRRTLRALLLLAGLIAAAPARAQFVAFSRCHGAYPCNVPFMIQYNPDPLIAGPYAQGAPTSAVSAHVALTSPPSIELDKPAPAPLSGDVVDASVKAFLKRYPPKKTAPKEKASPDPQNKAPETPAEPPPQKP